MIRRFSVYAAAALMSENGAWLDTGFCEYQSGRSGDADGVRPDVVFGRLGASDDELSDSIIRLMPKVIVLISDVSVTLPVDLQEEYTLYSWHKAGRYYIVGTGLEQLFTEPEWAAYDKEGQIAEKRYLKAVSDQVYRYLLADVFRETREWCGHTFSVVGHM